MRNIKRYLKKYWYIFIGIIAGLVIALSVGGNNSALPVYIPTPSSSELPSPSPSPTTDISQYDTYDDGVGFTISVPKWQKITDGNVVSFTDRGSGTILTIEKMDYDPEINLWNSNSFSQFVMGKNETAEAFNKLSPFSLAGQSYIQQGERRISIYRYYRWTTKHIYIITFKVSDLALDVHFKHLQNAIDSIVVPEDEDYPNGYVVYYNSFVACEFLYPGNWSTNFTDTSLTASNLQTSSTLQFSFSEYDESFRLSLLDQVTYSNIIGQNMQGFMLRKYINSGDTLVSQAVYSTATGTRLFQQYMYEDPVFHYNITLDIPESASNTDGEAFNMAINSFKFYGGNNASSDITQVPPAATDMEAGPDAAEH